MNTHYDAIIIGAGPAGSTAAILLAQAGWSVALVEKQVFPRRKVCGECIAAPNLALLETLGLGQEFNALAGAPLRRVGLFSGKHALYADLPAFDASGYRWGKALGREYLDVLLLQRATSVGAHVLQPYSARNIEGGPGHFSCEIVAADTPASATLTATAVIAANGSWEPAPFAQARIPKKPHDLFGFKANYRNSGVAAGSLPVLAFAGGYGGMVVGDHAITTLACCIRRDMLAQCRQRYATHTAAEAVEAYLRSTCSGVAAALDGAQRQESWLSVGPIRPGIRINARDLQQPMLIGNAAGEAHPIIGEGISMAMQSAWLLSQRLIAHKQDLLHTQGYRRIKQDYAGDWRRSFTARIRLSALFAQVAMRPVLTNRLLPLLQRWPELLTQGARFSGKARSAIMQ
jgi:2-polyprenyl-6-methoxyphenol hydroxylase-like FAD-dependent oxidoreductase